MNQTAAHDDRLEEALAAYFKAADAGQPIDRAALLARYPDLADDLAGFFADQDKLDSVLAPLRALSPSQVFGQAGTAEEPTTVNSPNAAQPPTTDDPKQPSSDRIGKFTIVRRLGSGGQASAILAFDPDLHRHVVLKLFREAKTAEQQETVLREGRALAQVHSPFVAQCHDVQRLDGTPYLIVEHIAGRSLADLIDSRKYAVNEALRLVVQLAEGLAAVHACGLLHRDLKPANVIVGDDGVPRLIDFGLAAPFASDHLRNISGTLPYMAGEQARGEFQRIDGRTDVFGLGGILYELLTGQRPHEAPTRSELWEKARRGDVVPASQHNPKLPRRVSDIVMRCLAKEPAQRYASADALAGDLRTYLHRTRRRLMIGAVAACALVGLLLVGGVAIVAANMGRSPPAPTHAVDAGPLTGDLNVLIWAPDKRGLTVDQPLVLPVRNDEQVQVEVRLNQPAYVYLVWIDSEGVATPLYPWNTGGIAFKDLKTAPPLVQAREAIHSPANLGKGWRVEGKTGLDTILLLARKTPLPADVDLHEIIGRLPPTPYHRPTEWAKRGFDAGEPVDQIDLGQNRAPKEEAARIDDPLLQRMARLKDHFEMIRAVRFAHVEK